jgi:hypothetical protein
LLGDSAKPRGDDLVVAIRVIPRAKHDAIVGVVDGTLRVRTTAPPADGKANKAVISLIAKHLGLAPSRIEVLRGHTQRNKQLLIRGPIAHAASENSSRQATNGL